MHSKIHGELDQVVAGIRSLEKRRKDKIKEHQTGLLTRVEDDLLTLLEINGFFVTEHHHRSWVVAVKGANRLRIWFAPENQLEHSQYLNLAFNGVKTVLYPFIDHTFVVRNQNYESTEGHLHDEKDRAMLKQELASLKQLGVSDITGNYVIFSKDKNENLIFLGFLESCFAELVTTKEQ